MAGVDLYSVKELLGHHDFKMIQRYAHLSPGHLKAAVGVSDVEVTQKWHKRRQAIRKLVELCLAN